MTKELPVDWQRVEDFTLALMYLTTFEEQGSHCTWKGHSWDVLDRLHAKGFISNPVGKAKSVALSVEGRKRSRELFLTHLAAR